MLPADMPVTPLTLDARPQKPSRVPELWEAAQKVEASFLAEMLKQSGVGEPLKSFGGGAGEEAFSSYLVDIYAEKLTEKGGIGLADQIYNSLKRSADEAAG